MIEMRYYRMKYRSIYCLKDTRFLGEQRKEERYEIGYIVKRV